MPPMEMTGIGANDRRNHPVAIVHHAEGVPQAY
jgi:hypothetical protein